MTVRRPLCQEEHNVSNMQQVNQVVNTSFYPWEISKWTRNLDFLCTFEIPSGMLHTGLTWGKLGYFAGLKPPFVCAKVAIFFIAVGDV